MRNEKKNKINIDHESTVRHISSYFKGEMAVQLMEPPSQAWVYTVLNVQEENGKGQTREKDSLQMNKIKPHIIWYNPTMATWCFLFEWRISTALTPHMKSSVHFNT